MNSFAEAYAKQKDSILNDVTDILNVEDVEELEEDQHTQHTLNRKFIDESGYCNQISQIDQNGHVSNRDAFSDLTRNHTIAYIASSIEKRIQTSAHFNCKKCFDASTCLQSKRKNLIEVFQAARISNHRLGALSKYANMQKNFSKFMTFVINSMRWSRWNLLNPMILGWYTLDLKSLYEKSDFVCIGHKYEFIKSIVGLYISIRASFFCNELTFDQYKTFLRTKLNKMILFSGQ